MAYWEVSVDSLEAFGISISTRQGRARELAEMLDFCISIANKGLQDQVVSLFYDSKSCCCNFELSSSVERHSLVEENILATARDTISQFDWHGTVEHGCNNG
jgi:hypothetical protein